MNKKLRLTGAALLLAGGILTPILMSGCGRSGTTKAANAGDGERKEKAVSLPAATYNDEGKLLRPANHREWVFIGAPVTPNDMNDGKAAFPEFHNVYIDPASFAAYKQTGKFTEGTVILKELVSVGGRQLHAPLLPIFHRLLKSFFA